MGGARVTENRFTGEHATCTLIVPEESQYAVLEVRSGSDVALFLVNDFVLRALGDGFHSLLDQWCNLPVDRLPGAPFVEDVHGSLISFMEHSALMKENLNNSAAKAIRASRIDLGADDRVSEYIGKVFELSSCKTLRRLHRKVLLSKILESRLHAYPPPWAGRFPQGGKESLEEALKRSIQSVEEEVLRLSEPTGIETESLAEVAFLQHDEPRRGSTRKASLKRIDGIDLKKDVGIALCVGPVALCWRVRMPGGSVRPGSLVAPVWRSSFGFALVPLKQGVPIEIDDLVDLLDWDAEASVHRKKEKLEKLVSLLDSHRNTRTDLVYPGLPIGVYLDGVREPGAETGDVSLTVVYGRFAAEVFSAGGEETFGCSASILELSPHSHESFYRMFTEFILTYLKKKVYEPLSKQPAVALLPESEPPRVFVLRVNEVDVVEDEGPVTTENIRRIVKNSEDFDYIEPAYPAAIMPYCIGEVTKKMKKLGRILGIARYGSGEVSLHVGLPFSAGNVRIKGGIPVCYIDVDEREIVFDPEVESKLKKAVREAIPRWNRVLMAMKRMVAFKP